jgi:hypothetical protein
MHATCAQNAAAIEIPADYAAITSTALTHLSLVLPDSATALPQQMAGMLSACSKLEDVGMRSSVGSTSGLVDISALAAGTQLLSLKLPWCFHLTNVAPLAALVNLESLDMSGCLKCLSCCRPSPPGEAEEPHEQLQCCV